MLHQTFSVLGQLWQLFEVSQILEFLRYTGTEASLFSADLRSNNEDQDEVAPYELPHLDLCYLHIQLFLFLVIKC